MLNRPDYIALDAQGFEVTRKAKVIGELPQEARAAACVEAASAIAEKLNLPAPECIKFAVPVFQSFRMTRQQAKNHKASALLLTPGHDVSLDYCASYNEPAELETN